MSSTSTQMPATALNQFNSTLATQPLYNALNLQQLQQYGLPNAEEGQKIANSNALAGARTNFNQLVGPGGASAIAASGINRLANPNYYQAQDAASRGAAEGVNAISLNGLSPGEFNATERANNRSLSGSGNLGLNNNTNTIRNAMNFGGAFNSKLGLMNNAVNTASNAANSAAGNGGFNAVNVALGQPNVSTAGNFGTGTFTNTNAQTGNANATNTFGMGNSLLGGMVGMNNSATQGAYGLAAANAVPNYIPNISC